MTVPLGQNFVTLDRNAPLESMPMYIEGKRCMLRSRSNTLLQKWTSSCYLPKSQDQSLRKHSEINLCEVLDIIVLNNTILISV